MANYSIRFNSKSRSANVEIAKQMLNKLSNCEKKDDGQYYLISGDCINKDVIELFLVVEQWKGSELQINGKTINDHYLIQSIINCNRRHYCNGECIFLNKWNMVFSILDNKKDLEGNAIDESLFNVEDHSDILVESDENFFTIKTNYLQKDFNQYCQMYLAICPKFHEDHYLGIFKNIPSTIKVKRIKYLDLELQKERNQEIILNNEMEKIIVRVGDEIENRMRKVLGEYLKK